MFFMSQVQRRVFQWAAAVVTVAGCAMGLSLASGQTSDLRRESADLIESVRKQRLENKIRDDEMRKFREELVAKCRREREQQKAEVASLATVVETLRSDIKRIEASLEAKRGALLDSFGRLRVAEARLADLEGASPKDGP